MLADRLGVTVEMYELQPELAEVAKEKRMEVKLNPDTLIFVDRAAIDFASLKGIELELGECPALLVGIYLEPGEKIEEKVLTLPIKVLEGYIQTQRNMRGTRA